MADLLVRLYQAPLVSGAERLRSQGVLIKKGSFLDKNHILAFVEEHFPGSGTWARECEFALLQQPSCCYIAVKEQRVIGFACYDSIAKGYFGPLGVDKAYRKLGIGKELTVRCLQAMKESGYGYAVIGWAAPGAIPFYQRTVGATLIEDSEPENSVYQNLIRME